MTFAVRIKENAETSTPWRFEKSFSNAEEFRHFERICINQERFKPPYFVTVRTDTCKNFCEDFFLPSVIHTALKTKDLATRIFLGIVYFIADLVTLPIRLITLIPCYLENKRNTKANHPLHQYLVAQRADPRILNPDHVYLEKHAEETLIGETFNYVPLPSGVSNTSRVEIFSGRAATDLMLDSYRRYLAAGQPRSN